MTVVKRQKKSPQVEYRREASKKEARQWAPFLSLGHPSPSFEEFRLHFRAALSATVVGPVSRL
jgi:hypothetical protein